MSSCRVMSEENSSTHSEREKESVPGISSISQEKKRRMVTSAWMAAFTPTNQYATGIYGEFRHP